MRGCDRAAVPAARPTSTVIAVRTRLLTVCTVVLLLTAACSDDDGASADDPEDRVRIISTTSSTVATSSTASGPSSTTDGSSSTTAGGSSTSVSSSTSVAGDTTTTTEDVPDVSNLSTADRISTVGLGPVFVGMTVAEASQAAASAFEPDGEVRGPCTFYVATDFADVGVRWLVAFDRIAVVHVDQPGIVTLSGVGVGSSAEEVRAAYGDLIEERPSPFDPAVTELVLVPVDENDANQRVIFEVDGSGNVVAFHSGQRPEVSYSATCDRR